MKKRKILISLLLAGLLLALPLGVSAESGEPTDSKTFTVAESGEVCPTAPDTLTAKAKAVALTATADGTEEIEDGAASDATAQGGAASDNSTQNGGAQTGATGATTAQDGAQTGATGATSTQGGAAGDTTAQGGAQTGTEPNEDGVGVAKNPFEEVLEELSGYATEIICTLTLIGSLILTYAYKKGLLPLVKDALSAISGAVGRVKDSAESQSREMGEGLDRICEALGGVESTVNALGDGISRTSERLDRLESECGSALSLEVIMREQVALLSDVFMSSSLPQYKKDAVGERLAKMKEALGENVEN